MDLENKYPQTAFALAPAVHGRLLVEADGVRDHDALVLHISRCVEEGVLPAYVPFCLEVEHAAETAREYDWTRVAENDSYRFNPTLRLFETAWNVEAVLEDDAEPVQEPDTQRHLMVFAPPHSGDVRYERARPNDLLALKVVAENLSLEQVAAAGGTTVDFVQGVLLKGVRRGYLLGPASRLRRLEPPFRQPDLPTRDNVMTAGTFTLQWHITNACDLHCKHCYDRVSPSPLTLEQGYGILESLRAFVRERFVRGHVCFSGGNPFFSPHFKALYRRAAELGFSTSILGNPVSRQQLKEIVALRRPGYYQVSLEGLREHNDFIRGEGFYLRVLEFLGVLRDLKVSSAIMLTLTRENMDQVLPLAERLRGHTDYFTFNRLSQVGEGAELLLPDKEEYANFLREYVDASCDNHIMGFKDNLINCVLAGEGTPLFSGCTGYGCGAAFNFITILPDGQAHACRKFPSPIGDAFTQSIGDIYDSDAAERYRAGSAACSGCQLRAVCGGCMAVTHGASLDPLRERDPFCFYHSEAAGAL